MSLDSFGQLMYFSIVFGYCFNFHNSSKILSFPFMSGKNNIFKYLPSASVLFFFLFLWSYWQFFRRSHQFLKLPLSERCGWIPHWMSLKKVLHVSKATGDFHVTDTRSIWSLVSIFCFFKAKNKHIFLCDTWLPGCYLIKNTKWLCTNYDSEHFPRELRQESDVIWCDSWLLFLSYYWRQFSRWSVP